MWRINIVVIIASFLLVSCGEVDPTYEESTSGGNSTTDTSTTEGDDDTDGDGSSDEATTGDDSGADGETGIENILNTITLNTTSHPNGSDVSTNTEPLAYSVTMTYGNSADPTRSPGVYLGYYAPGSVWGDSANIACLPTDWGYSDFRVFPNDMTVMEATLTSTILLEWDFWVDGGKQVKVVFCDAQAGSAGVLLGEISFSYN